MINTIVKVSIITEMSVTELTEEVNSFLERYNSTDIISVNYVIDESSNLSKYQCMLVYLVDKDIENLIKKALKD
jgi:hypothetical protein